MRVSANELQEFTVLREPRLTFPLEATAVRLGLGGSQTREITSVSIGRDYLQGVLEDGQSVGFIRLSEIARLEFLVSSEPNQQRIIFTGKTLSEQIQKVPAPCLAKIKTRHQPSTFQTHWFLGASRRFLILEANPNYFVPLASVAFIELRCG
jgi:hypothetical protein